MFINITTSHFPDVKLQSSDVSPHQKKKVKKREYVYVSNRMKELASQWSRQHTPMNHSVMPAKLICFHHELDSPVKKTNGENVVKLV